MFSEILMKKMFEYAEVNCSLEDVLVREEWRHLFGSMVTRGPNAAKYQFSHGARITAPCMVH